MLKKLILSFVMLAAVRDLLWPIYLFCLAWIFTPIYVGVLALVLPINETDVDKLLLIALVLVGPLACWSGFKGGPLLLSEATVLFDLVLGRKQTPLSEAIVKQGLLAAAVGGVAGVCLVAMSANEDFSLSSSLWPTVRGFGVGVMYVALAVLWSTTGKRRILDRLIAVVCSAAPIVTDALNPAGSTLVTLAVMGVGLVSSSYAVWRCTAIPVPVLWERSRGLANLTVSTRLLDLHSFMSQLRSFRDGPRVHRGFLVRGKLVPLSVWRFVRFLSNAPVVALLRIVLITLTIAVGLIIVPSTNAAFMLSGVLLFVAGTCLAEPIGSLSAQPLLSNVAAIRWVSLLVGQLVLVSAAVATVALASWVAADLWNAAPPFWSWMGLAVAAAIATSLQARNGLPDVAKILDTFGFSLLGTTLATRALVPIAVTLSAVIGLTRVARGETSIIDISWIAVIGIATLAVVTPVRASQ